MLDCSGTYEFGYEVGPDGQFHHENRGPDGVVYGCYGYVDPNGKPRVTFYVSDGWGYRVVKRGEAVELFLHPHNPQDVEGGGNVSEDDG
jgi:integrin beta 8